MALRNKEPMIAIDGGEMHTSFGAKASDTIK